MGNGSDFTLHAWVDESMHVRDGLYILAAVVCDPTGCDSTRDTLRSLRYKRQERLHWRDEDEPRRAKIAAAVAEVDMAAVVVIGAPMENAKQERARRLCMETLLRHLGEMTVTQVWLESRTPSLNTRDARHIEKIRGSRIIPKTLRVDSKKPSLEPMLWMPDIVAGAVGAARLGATQYLEMINKTVTELEIELH